MKRYSGPLGKETEQWVDRHLTTRHLKSSCIDIDIPHSPMSTLTIKPHKSTINYYTETLSSGVEMEMALILGGEFQMGSPEDEKERRDNEQLHTVTVPTFFMGCTPVTQGQWRSIVQLSKNQTDLKPNPSHFKGDDLPVENVSWDDAIEFCRLLSARTGRTYRLPSEAEWEYACRAGTITPFHFGETIDANLANYDGNYTYGKGVEGSYSKKTILVKTIDKDVLYFPGKMTTH